MTEELHRWQIGDVRITRVQELEAPDIRFVIPDATVENLATIPWLGPFRSPNGHALASVHTLILEVGERRIVVDTCIGNDKPRPIPPWNMLKLPFLEDLEKAGFAPSSIDTVICTHLHIDHVGWNTRLVDGRWVPTFPNARYLFGRVEYEHWSRQTERADMLPVFADSVKPLLERGLADLVEWDHQLCPEIRLMPSAGHTPGHASVLISSKGKRAMITGDFAHHPCQMAHPEWSSTADYDPVASEATRRRVFGDLAGEPVLVIGTHFAGPTAGHVVRDGNAFKLIV